MSVLLLFAGAYSAFGLLWAIDRLFGFGGDGIRPEVYLKLHRRSEWLPRAALLAYILGWFGGGLGFASVYIPLFGSKPGPVAFGLFAAIFLSPQFVRGTFEVLTDSSPVLVNGRGIRFFETPRKLGTLGVTRLVGTLIFEVGLWVLVLAWPQSGAP